MLLLPAGKRKKWKCFAKFLYQVLKKKVALFFYPQTCIQQNYLQACLLLFFIETGVSAAVFVSLFQKKKRREGPHRVSYTEEKLQLSTIITISIISQGQLTLGTTFPLLYFKVEHVWSLTAYFPYLSFIFICWIKSENGPILLKKEKEKVCICYVWTLAVEFVTLAKPL